MACYLVGLDSTETSHLTKVMNLAVTQGRNRWVGQYGDQSPDQGNEPSSYTGQEPVGWTVW
jgi:hypothetical protein